MDFVPSDDQQTLADELRRLLAGACDPDTRRAAIDLPGAVDRSLWSTLADTGVFSLTVPAKPMAASGSGGPTPRSCSRSWAGPRCPVRSSARAGCGPRGRRRRRLGRRRRRASAAPFARRAPRWCRRAPGGRRRWIRASIPAGELAGRLMERPTDPLTPVTSSTRCPTAPSSATPPSPRRLRLGTARCSSPPPRWGWAPPASTWRSPTPRSASSSASRSARSRRSSTCAPTPTPAVELARAAVQAAGVEIDEAAASEEARGPSPPLARGVATRRWRRGRRASRSTAAWASRGSSMRTCCSSARSSSTRPPGRWRVPSRSGRLASRERRGDGRGCAPAPGGPSLGRRGRGLRRGQGGAGGDAGGLGRAGRAPRDGPPPRPRPMVRRPSPGGC